MKALIIEDEYPAAERLTKLIQKAGTGIEVTDVIGSIEAARGWFATHKAPDLIFSDIQLSDGLSFVIFEEIPLKSPIIFTTSYDEYAIKAFKVKSIDYLLKPIKPQELTAAIEKYRALTGSHSPQEYGLKIQSLLDSLPMAGRKFKTRFLVKQQEQLVPIHQHEIAYFFTTNELVCLVRHDNRQFLVDYTLEELEKLLDTAHFFRLNRQYIAALSAVKNIHTYFNGKLKLELHPEPMQEILISREKAPAFKEWVEG
ncbi:LytR/AlgR family response regulator transcription factor [Runella slithyformis]|uniref:Two component transcriptional regulator, LytTR family n=1 Tax=Runella slithyformis (strain ATCC 29530 / DSM 19594 / LMG 11500 / NCIMB 11436 / LSU 4) TaxID=761193 RepID=A0A7U3ZPU1_RUNSL|nr:LytTR family DNA-binding domain-containing protein [Runella slithyformis]AEI51162.1 two component transcriptional regulator, LytTR family [Runella slithyformis DSM 19594]